MKDTDAIKTKKTVIIVGYACNNNCRFCVDINKRQLPNKTTRQILDEMAGAKKRGTTYLEFIGGEMTIRPDFIDLLKEAKKLRFNTVMIATNGRMLAYPDYAKKVVSAGLTNVVFSIHGYNAKEHDFLTQSEGSFEQLMAGLANMKKLFGLEAIGSNTTIVKYNYKNLPKIGKMIYGLGIRNSEFIFVDCNEGAAYNNFEKLAPKISVAAPFIRRCLDIGKKNKVPHWHIRYVPLCYFVDYLGQISELLEVEQFHTEHLAPDFVNWDVEGSRPEVGREKAAICLKCRLYHKCEGIWKNYIKHYGAQELRPILEEK